jgi:hypothetical protein
LAAITSSTMASSAPLSFICFRPLASISASTSAAFARPQRVEHLARAVVRHRAVDHAADQRGQLAADTGAASIVPPSALSRLDTSPISQLAASLACAQASRTAS